MKNGYFIGNIPNIFRHILIVTPKDDKQSASADPSVGLGIWNVQRRAGAPHLEKHGRTNI